MPKKPPPGAAVPGYAPINSSPPQAYFVGVEGKATSAANSYWVIPSQQSWTHAASGNSSAFRAPAGTWYSTSAYTKTNEPGMVVKTEDGKVNHKVQFGILKKGAVAPPWGPVPEGLLTREFWDPNAEKMRNKIAGHGDETEGKDGEAAKVGSLGCFTCRDTPATWGKGGTLEGPATGTVNPQMILQHQDAMKAVFTGPGVPMQVEYYKTQAEVEARVTQLTKDYDIWNRPLFLSQPPVTAPPSLAGTDKVGIFNLQFGRTDVLVGKDCNPLAFAAPECTHKGGGSVLDGSHTVRVGAELFPVGRETDPTTDGLLLKSDVEFLRIGD